MPTYQTKLAALNLPKCLFDVDFKEKYEAAKAKHFEMLKVLEGLGYEVDWSEPGAEVVQDHQIRNHTQIHDLMKYFRNEGLRPNRELKAAVEGKQGPWKNSRRRKYLEARGYNIEEERAKYRAKLEEEAAKNPSA